MRFLPFNYAHLFKLLEYLSEKKPVNFAYILVVGLGFVGRRERTSSSGSTYIKQANWEKMVGHV